MDDHSDLTGPLPADPTAGADRSRSLPPVGSPSHSTRWTLIQRAAAGSPEDRDDFARRYGLVIRAYLEARWRRTPFLDQLDDAVQQVFVECFKDDGALARVVQDHPTNFRGYLYGIVRNVARHTERTIARGTAREAASVEIGELAAQDESLARVFDRAWASALLRDAAQLQLARAQAKGHDAIRRHRLLRLRYGEDLPIRTIAERWDVDPAWLHGQYRQSRNEFRAALEDVVRELHGDSDASTEAECVRLLEIFF